jgi:hypothetical protein
MTRRQVVSNRHPKDLAPSTTASQPASLYRIIATASFEGKKKDAPKGILPTEQLVQFFCSFHRLPRPTGQENDGSLSRWCDDTDAAATLIELHMPVDQ